MYERAIRFTAGRSLVAGVFVIAFTLHDTIGIGQASAQTVGRPNVIVDESVLDQLGPPPQSLPDVILQQQPQSYRPAPRGEEATATTATQMPPSQLLPPPSAMPRSRVMLPSALQPPASRQPAPKPQVARVPKAAPKPAPPAPAPAPVAKVPAPEPRPAPSVVPTEITPPTATVPDPPKIVPPTASAPDSDSPPAAPASAPKPSIQEPSEPPVAKIEPPEAPPPAVPLPKVEPPAPPVATIPPVPEPKAPETPETAAVPPPPAIVPAAPVTAESESASERPVAANRPTPRSADTAPRQLSAATPAAESAAKPAADTAADKEKSSSQIAALPAPARAEILDGGQLYRIPFTPDSSEISDGGRKHLDDLAQRLKKDSALRLQLLGYAGSTQDSASKARRTSLFRALSVRTYLMKQGIRSTRMDVRALGNLVEDGAPDRVDAVVRK